VTWDIGGAGAPTGQVVTPGHLLVARARDLSPAGGRERRYCLRDKAKQICSGHCCLMDSGEGWKKGWEEEALFPPFSDVSNRFLAPGFPSPLGFW
jgi:hypothetical protein